MTETWLDPQLPAVCPWRRAVTPDAVWAAFDAGWRPYTIAAVLYRPIDEINAVLMRRRPGGERS